MEPKIAPIDAKLGAVVTGLDLSLRVSVDRDHADRSIVITRIGPRDHPAGQASSGGRVAGA